MKPEERTKLQDEKSQLEDNIRQLQASIQAMAHNPTQENYSEKVQAEQAKIASHKDRIKEINRALLQDELDNL